jgi:serine/threonine protein kinase
MRCPRCLLADIPEGARACVLCGYSPDARAASGVGAQPTPPASPARTVRGRRTTPAGGSAPTDPHGSHASTAVAEETDVVPTELDARRELSAEFRIEALLRGSPEPIVYVAWDGADHPLTLKAVARQQLGATEDRFTRAAEAAMQLEHSHIVPPLRFGCTDHFLWYATKRVEGRSLQSMLETVGALEVATCVRILEQVASALDHAHRRGLAHGGLRSDCVIVGANEWVQVSDFLVGGVFQVPPDEARASEPGPRADQYALAALAYECLTGTPVRDAPPLSRLLDDRGDIPLHVSQALRRALSSRPAERFPTVLDFVTALGGPTAAARAAAPSAAWFEATPQQRSQRSPVVIVADDEEEDDEMERPPPPPARRTGRYVVAAGVIIVLGVAVWLGTSSAPASQPSTYDASIPPAQALPSPPPERTGADTVAIAAQRPPAMAAEPRAVEPPPPAAVREPARRQPNSAPVTRAPARRTPPPVSAPPRRVARPAARSSEPALLSVNSVPWGSVYVDGQPVGNTPQIDLEVPSGSHRLRVERDGFRPYERMIELAPGQRLRITDIALVER